MQYKTKSELDTMDSIAILNYVNGCLENTSFNQFLKHSGLAKGYIKHKLKGYEYSNIAKQFIATTTTDTDTLPTNTTIEEVQPMEHTEQLQQDTTTTNDDVLLQIRDLLVSMDSSLGAINGKLEPMEQPSPALSPATLKVDSNNTNSIDNIKPIKSDETLIIRNFKVYPSLANRLKKLTTDTDYQVQQVFNALLDEVLSKYGY